MSKPSMAPNMVPSVKRIHHQMRRLNTAYMEAEDKRETVTVLQAYMSELVVVHSLLPAGLRRKSWLLSMERYVA